METALYIAQKLAEQTTVSISKEALDKLASVLVRNEIKKGQNFLSEGEVCTQMGYVYKGLVRQYYYKNGKEMTEHFCCEDGVFICIESFLRQKPSRLVVEALENTVIYGIPHDPILKLAEECYEIEKVYCCCGYQDSEVGGTLGNELFRRAYNFQYQWYEWD